MYHFSINTPEKIVFDGIVKSVIVPGEEGYFQVLTDHAALISTLRPGKLTVTDQDGQNHFWTVTGGLFEVDRNQAVLLADDIQEGIQAVGR